MFYAPDLLYGSTLTATTLAPPPDNLNATAVSSSQINLHWSSVENATEYVVQQEKSGSWVTIATVSGNTLTDAVQHLGAALTNTFRVATVTAAGTGAFLEPAKCTDLANCSDELHRQGGLDFADRPLLECRGRRRGLLGLLQVHYKSAWTWLKTLAPGQTSLAVTVSPGVTYQFEVGAYNVSGYTFCNPISARPGSSHGLLPRPT